MELKNRTDKEEKRSCSKKRKKGSWIKFIVILFIVLYLGPRLLLSIPFWLYKSTMETHRQSRDEQPFERMTRKYPPPRTVEEEKELVLTSLKNKYGEEFVGYQWDTMKEEDFMYSSIYYVYPKNTSEKDKFRVVIMIGKNGDYHFFDNYFEIFIKDRYREYIEDILDDLYPEFFLDIDVGARMEYSDRFTKDIKINEIYVPNELRYSTTIKIYVSEQLLNNKSISKHAWEIGNKMLEHNIDCDVLFYVVKNSKYDYFKEKNGKVYPSRDDPDFYIKREQIDSEFYVIEEGMEQEYFEMYTGPIKEKNNNLGIVWYTGKERE